MPIAARVMQGGVSAGTAIAMGGGVAATVSAAGTTQGTATALTASNNYLSTVAASSGVILPAAQPGDDLWVYNGGANAALIYPPSSAKINNAATNAGVSLATQSGMILKCMTATQWIGIASA